MVVGVVRTRSYMGRRWLGVCIEKDNKKIPINVSQKLFETYASMYASLPPAFVCPPLSVIAQERIHVVTPATWSEKDCIWSSELLKSCFQNYSRSWCLVESKLQGTGEHVGTCFVHLYHLKEMEKKPYTDGRIGWISAGGWGIQHLTVLMTYFHYSNTAGFVCKTSWAGSPGRYLDKGFPFMRITNMAMIKTILWNADVSSSASMGLGGLGPVASGDAGQTLGHSCLAIKKRFINKHSYRHSYHHRLRGGHLSTSWRVCWLMSLTHKLFETWERGTRLSWRRTKQVASGKYFILF